MKTKSIISLILCLIMAFSVVACNNANLPAETTEAPVPSETPETTKTPVEATPPPAETTEAPIETTEAPVVTTEAHVETSVSIEFGDLPADEQAALKAVMPASLPDLSSYEIVSRAMSFDRGDDDYIFATGYSYSGTSFVDSNNGAMYGQALKIVSSTNYADNKRAQVSITPINDVNITDAKGVLFYVDFSDVVSIGEPDKMCASVTINGNNYRSNGSENKAGSAVGYYYSSGSWTQTTNIVQCRMQIPDNFAGWIYVPSTSFYGQSEGSTLGETFGDIIVLSMRIYTDGYTPSEEHSIIVDEIVFVK